MLVSCSWGSRSRFRPLHIRTVLMPLPMGVGGFVERRHLPITESNISVQLVTLVVVDIKPVTLRGTPLVEQLPLVISKYVKPSSSCIYCNCFTMVLYKEAG